MAQAMEVDATQAMEVDAVVGFSDAVLDEAQRFETASARAQSLGLNNFYSQVVKYCDPSVVDAMSGEHLLEV